MNTKWKKGLKLFLIASTALMVALFGYIYYLFNQFGDNIYREVQASDTEEAEKPIKDNSFGITDLFTNSFKEPLTLLVLGLDARAGETIDTARTDTIMVITINPDTQQIAAVSFPRDTYVLLPGYDHQKINSAMYYGGLDLLEKTIEYNFDITIDKYLALDFQAFQEIVDILGGIEVYTPSSMYYVASDIHVELTPGYHNLNGEELLGYVRYRNDSAGDIGRISRQQYAIRALGEKASDLKTIIKAPAILDALGEHLYTDLTKQELLSVIKAYRDFSNQDWHPLTLGGSAARSEKDNLWYYFYNQADKEEVTAFINRYRDGE